MPVTRKQIMNELSAELVNSGDIADDFADVGDQVENHWQTIARDNLDAGYATGEYVSSIHRVSTRGRRAKGSVNAAGKKIGGQFVWHTKVVTHDDKAHLLEYGTLPDGGPSGPPNYPKPPLNGGHWYDTEGEYHWWWNTPTKAYNFVGQVELDFR